MVYGLNSATGKYFCIWCYCTKAKICDFSIQDWPIERNLQQCIKNSAEKTTDGRKGSIHEPIISIPFTQVIVDTLHLFLRIMGLLFHQEKTSEQSYAKWIFKPIFEGTSQQKMSYKDVKKLWKGFSDLVEALDSEPGQENYKTPQQFKDHARMWARFFQVVHYDEDVTSYIHALVYHVPQFLEQCGALSIFNCQTVEKKNHQQSRMFHQGTQKGGWKSSYTKQVMVRENREIYARVNNLYRTKRTYQRWQHTEEEPGALHLYTHQNVEEGENVLCYLIFTLNV
ncbi:uncharacterized protein [Acropora muricata]|uniref:uncharacterized protein n=1 Tax=Acropora muricata TaxID=159855 RepID=UPI0034E5B1A6